MAVLMLQKVAVNVIHFMLSKWSNPEWNVLPRFKMAKAHFHFQKGKEGVLGQTLFRRHLMILKNSMEIGKQRGALAYI